MFTYVSKVLLPEQQLLPFGGTLWLDGLGSGTIPPGGGGRPFGCGTPADDLSGLLKTGPGGGGSLGGVAEVDWGGGGRLGPELAAPWDN